MQPTLAEASPLARAAVAAAFFFYIYALYAQVQRVWVHPVQEAYRQGRLSDSHGRCQAAGARSSTRGIVELLSYLQRVVWAWIGADGSEE